MHSRRGDVQKNSERKRRSQTLGRPGEQMNQPRVPTFFGSQESNTTLTPTVTIMPNNDVDPMNYDKDIHSKGNRLYNSVNLSRQKQHIMSNAYYKKPSIR